MFQFWAELEPSFLPVHRMTIGDINTKISFLTSADITSGGFATADRVISINYYYNRVLTAILRSQDEWDFDDNTITTTYPIAVRNMVINQPDYKFTTALWALTSPEGGANASSSTISPLKIKRVELSYDGTNWNKAEPLDLNEYSRDTITNTINSQFQTGKPFYGVMDNALWLYPVPTANVTNGIKVWFDRSITEYTSSDVTTGTKVPGFDSNFHMILAYGAAYEYGVARGKDNTKELKGELEQLMAEMQNYYGDKEKDRVYALKSNYVKYS